MLAADWQAFGQAILHSMRDVFVNKEISSNHKDFSQLTTTDLKR
jgi:hypothetical protein